MADPLLAKLDRLMRQMERGQLLDDELNIDEIDGGVENGRRAPRRRRRAKKFKNWDNGTTSSRLPEYDALRDPHCRYTKQRQFKQQWEQFSKAAMIQEVLRGDHASLLDVLHRKKKVKGTKGRSPRANLTDRSEYSLDGRPKKKTRRRGRKRRGVKASTNVGSNNTSGGLPRVRQARGRQKHATALANRIYGAPGGSPSAPSRGDFSMDIPTLPPMFSKEMLRGGISKRRIKNVNESWKRTGATSSVNAAVLRYRTKQNQSSSKLARNAKIFHGDRVEQEYKRAKNITKSYSKKAKMAALREKALLPPLPDSNNFSPRGMAGHRHREKYGNKVMNDPTSNSMQLQESHLKSVENVNPEKLLQDSPVKDCVTENKGDILRKSTPPSRSIKAGTNSIPNLNRDQAPESSNSPPDSPTGYSDDDYEEDDDFENDDFEEEDETNDSKTIESGEQTRENSDPQNVEKRTTEKVISPQQEQRRIQKMYQKQAEEVAVTLDHDDSESHPIEVTIQDMSKNVSSQLRGCESLLHKLIFTKDENGSTTREDIMSLLSELNTSYFESGTGISKIDSVKDAVSETLSDVFARTSDSRRKALTITRCIRAVSRAANFALAEAAAAIDSAADSTESDAASQKKALTKVFAGDIVVKGFAAARLPLIIAQGILKTHAKTQECDATICESLDRILMATGLGFLRNEADASGRERYENFVGIIDSKLSLHSNSRLLYHYGPLLSAATKGIVSVLIWQSSHGGSEGDGTQRLRFAIARDSALEESYSWALDNHSNICWVPKAYTNGDPWNKRLSAQLLFPYFKRKKNAEKNDGSMLERGLEEGEGSGPRKEFFALVGSQLVKKSISAFVYVKSVESLWISPSETSNASLLRWIGYLMGCAFTSRCNLGVLMPKYIFIALLTPRKSELPDVDLAGLSEINPELCEGLHNLSRMSETDFAQLLEMEGFDRSMSRAEYVRKDMRDRVVDPVRKSLNELRTGFQSVVSIEWCKQVGMTASDLQLIICGNAKNENLSKDFNVREIFRLRMDEDFSDSPALQDALFEAIDAMNPLEKRMFLKFVTGVDKLPLPKTEYLKIEAPGLCFSEEEFQKQWHRLPTAHTCFNTLELPNYAQSLLELEYGGQSFDEIVDRKSFTSRLYQHMSNKLSIAIANTEGGGYGLDGAVKNREKTLLYVNDARSNETGESINMSSGASDVGSVSKLNVLQSGQENHTSSSTAIQDTARSSVQSFGENESDSSFDIPELSDTDDDDIFNEM